MKWKTILMVLALLASQASAEESAPAELQLGALEAGQDGSTGFDGAGGGRPSLTVVEAGSAGPAKAVPAKASAAKPVSAAKVPAPSKASVGETVKVSAIVWSAVFGFMALAGGPLGILAGAAIGAAFGALTGLLGEGLIALFS